MEALQSQLKLKRGNKRVSARRERLLLLHMPIKLDDISSANRPIVEQYIAERFYANYQAKISSFLPYLLSTQTDDKLTAAMGFQSAMSKQPLFIEQYLSTDIESTLSDLLNKPIARNKIAEVGNLTSSHQGTSQILFILTIAILHQAGFEWGVFTATQQVQQLLEKLNLQAIEICTANPDHLADQGLSWGNYYQDKPMVLAGNLADAVAALKQHKVIGFMLQNYQDTIIKMANQIKH